MSEYKDGGYVNGNDFDVATDFYTLFRGIFDAFWEALRKICLIFGVDINEGKTDEQ